ncbi:zinc metallopeptidase [bacterium BD-1]|uniref:KPN_02809 family neutral zinc metallopeptidase n=1 Tax=Arenimonas sp. TaxID=1872635 RepID=UPI001E28C034|nr:zinc metallopeptidase [Ottowia caeni]
MKWRSARRSSNVEDRRGMGPGGGGMKLGLGGIAAVVVIGLLLGKSPMEMLGLVAQVQQQAPAGPQAPPAQANDEASQFIASILGETEDVWGAVFEANGTQYTPARLVLFSGQVQSACGGATAAVGPFYCPGDQQVYIDLSFFEQMQARLGGGGDFAEAYVIAHEVGHHVQTLTGVSARVNEIRRRGGNVEGADGPLVRQELQADCYAGLWAHHAQKRHAWLEPGDLEEALNTATAIGDDTLQRQGQGQVVPDSFTHGSAEQRVRWFRTGFETGDVRRCDTFAAGAP